MDTMLKMLSFENDHNELGFEDLNIAPTIAQVKRVFVCMGVHAGGSGARVRVC
jgi:hypothetical protein